MSSKFVRSVSAAAVFVCVLASSVVCFAADSAAEGPIAKLRSNTNGVTFVYLDNVATTCSNPSSKLYDNVPYVDPTNQNADNTNSILLGALLSGRKVALAFATDSCLIKGVVIAK
jgi:hypothetical protein